jgi:hypothetical protein
VSALDKTFVQPYEKGDMATVKKYLDADFTWIDTDGVLYSKDDALALGLKPLVASGSHIKIVEHKCGKVVWIQENQGDKYAAHFWVERPAGWKLLHNTGIATRPRSENPGAGQAIRLPESEAFRLLLTSRETPPTSRLPGPPSPCHQRA